MATSASAPLAGDFESYDPPAGFYDEAFTEDGVAREHYAHVLEVLAELDLRRLRHAVDAHLAEREVTFGVPGGVCTFPVDPVPRILAPDEWAALEAGLSQRVRALNAFLADVYGERRMVAAGRIPERVTEAADPGAADLSVASGSHATVAGLDLIRGADGRFSVLEDNLRTPSGLAYSLAARDALTRSLPGAPPPLRSPHEAIELLGRALRASAPDGRPNPTVALLSDGPRNSAWYEHRMLADRLGVPIVTPPDLVVDGDRLVARRPDRNLDLDVLYRRTDEDRLVDRGGRRTELGRLLLEPLRAGTLACVNAFGNGVADDKLAHAYVEEMIRFYLGEEPLLPSVPTYDLGDPGCRDEALDRLDELVLKPRTGHGGYGVMVVGRADREGRDEARRRVLEHPERWIAQETIALSSHPTVVDATLAPRHVDLRPFVVTVDGEPVASPGALTRVAFREGSLIVNSSQQGGGKDTWVLR